MKEKRFERLMIWDVVSLAILLILMTLDGMNVDEWNIIWLYPYIRVPLVLDMMVLGFCLLVTLLAIIDMFDKDD